MASLNSNFLGSVDLVFNFVDHFGVGEGENKLLWVETCGDPEFCGVGSENVGGFESLIEGCCAANFYHLI